MAKNTSKGHRNGAVKSRSQVYNPKTKKFIKRDSETGLFMKSKDTPFKGVKKEKKVTDTDSDTKKSSKGNKTTNKKS